MGSGRRGHRQHAWCLRPGWSLSGSSVGRRRNAGPHRAWRSDLTRMLRRYAGLGAGILHTPRRSRRLRQRGWLQRGAASFVETTPGAAESNFVTMPERPFTRDPLTVHVRPVQTSQIAENVLLPPSLHDAVLLRHNLVEHLDGVTRVPSQGIPVGKLGNKGPLGCGEQQSRHFKYERLPPRPRADKRAHEPIAHPTVGGTYPCAFLAQSHVG